MKKDDIIRVNDKIKIKNPSFFIRCGYEMCVKEVAEQLRTSHSHEFKEFVSDLLSKYQKKFLKLNLDCSKMEYSFFSNLAYEKCSLNNFGGNERKIKTISIPELKDVILKVESVKFVKTGIRTTYHDYEEGSFSYLKNEKTHKILNLFDDYNLIELYDIYGEIINNLRIEAVNVEKIK